MTNEFPNYFKHLANVGDVIRAERVNGADYIIGTVTEKSPSAFWVGVTETSEASVLGKHVRVPYGLLADWADRVTLVRASGSNRAIENLSKALDGARSLIDGMLQRDEIQQREIAKLQAQLVTTQAAADSLHRKALTVDMVAKQRDDALRELAAMRDDRNAQRVAFLDAREDLLAVRGERNRLREQVDQLHESREKIISDRNFVQGQLEKAQADYRDLQSRMLKA